jgi:hypothetical protein
MQDPSSQAGAAAARQRALDASFRAIRRPPALLNGTGTGFELMGRLDDELLAPRALMMYWFTVFWVPLIPICVYLVGNEGRACRYDKQLPLGAFHAIYRGRLGRFYLGVLRETARMLLVIVISVVGMLAFILYSGRP